MNAKEQQARNKSLADFNLRIKEKYPMLEHDKILEAIQSGMNQNKYDSKTYLENQRLKNQEQEPISPWLAM